MKQKAKNLSVGNLILKDHFVIMLKMCNEMEIEALAKGWAEYHKHMKKPKVMADIKAIKSMRVKLKKKANL